MDRLSMLEQVVIGIVWKKGPLTPYAVRKEFTESPSSHFSGSAGAIYPLMERLEARDYLSSASEPHGKRPRTLYQASPKGEAALQEWLATPSLEDSSVTTYNPLRTRFYFLKALSPAKQGEFVENAETMLKEELARVKAQYLHYQAMGDLFSGLASRNAMLVLASQKKWLAEVIEQLAL